MQFLPCPSDIRSGGQNNGLFQEGGGEDKTMEVFSLKDVNNQQLSLILVTSRIAGSILFFIFEVDMHVP